MNQVWWKWKDGSFGFILCDWWLHIKAPWKPPLYGERYGGEAWCNWRGWRFKFRRMKRCE
jgi:hypothetical protein